MRAVHTAVRVPTHVPVPGLCSYGNVRRAQSSTPVRRGAADRSSTRAKRASRNLDPMPPRGHNTVTVSPGVRGGTVGHAAADGATVPPGCVETGDAGGGAVVARTAVLRRTRTGATTLVRRQTATFGSTHSLAALDTPTRSASGRSGGGF